MSKKRIGILTSGGDCPGLNAVIRGAVKASHQLGYDCVGFLKGYEGLHDPVQYVHLTPSTTRGILNQGGTILGSTNKGRFAATVGVQDRQEIAPHLIEGVKQTIDQLGITGLICVGGDGSLAVAQQFHEQGIPVVGVPKTIDNDLSATAFTFGFDSAIECATDALDRLHTTAASHERIMVLEVMGRHAGWIALHSGIAGGGDVILLPEIEWNWDHVCHKIMHRESQGKKFTLVVVAEGAELPGGELVGEQRAGQQMKLGGVGRAVTDEIERRLHRETRLSVLGHLQRGGKPTTFDRVLATQFGAHAVRLIKEERFGEMICSCPPDMKSVPIMEAVNELRRVNPHGPAVQAARALGISFGDRPADEIGQDVFDRLETIAPVEETDSTPDLEEASAVATEVVEVVELVEEAVAQESVSVESVTEPADTVVADETKSMDADSPTASLAVEPAQEPAQELVVESTVEPEPEPATETAPAEAPVAESTDESSDTPNIQPVANEEPAEAVAEPDAEEDAVAEETDEPAAESLVSEASAEEAAEEAVAALTIDEPAAETPVVEKPAAEVELAIDQPSAEETASPLAVEVAEAADEENSAEEATAEQIAETVLDLAADADELIHGSVEELTESAEENLAGTTRDELPTEAAESETTEADAPSPLETEPVEAAAPALAVEETAAIEAEAPEATTETPAVDLTAAQALLAERISQTAKVKRDAAPQDTTVSGGVAGLTVAELVKQKLAEASNAAKPSLEEPLDQPHGDDLVAEARSALEEALAD